MTLDFEKEVQKRVEQKQGNWTGVDPSPMNGARRMPQPVDMKEVGRKAYEKIKGKIRRNLL